MANILSNELIARIRAYSYKVPYFVYDTIYRDDFIYTNNGNEGFNELNAKSFYYQINKFYDFPFDEAPHGKYSVGIYVMESPFANTDSGYIIGFILQSGGFNNNITLSVMIPRKNMQNKSLDEIIKRLWYYNFISLETAVHNINYLNASNEYNNLFRNYILLKEDRSVPSRISTSTPIPRFDNISALERTISKHMGTTYSISNIDNDNIILNDGTKIKIKNPIYNELTGLISMEIDDGKGTKKVISFDPIKDGISNPPGNTEEEKRSVLKHAINKGWKFIFHDFYKDFKKYDQNIKIEDDPKDKINNNNNNKSTEFEDNNKNLSKIFNDNRIIEILRMIMRNEVPPQDSYIYLNLENDDYRLYKGYPFTLENLEIPNGNNYYISLNNHHEMRDPTFLGKIYRTGSNALNLIRKYKIESAVGGGLGLYGLSTETYKKAASAFCNMHPNWKPIIEPILSNPKTSLILAPILIAYGYPLIAKYWKKFIYDNFTPNKVKPIPRMN